MRISNILFILMFLLSSCASKEYYQVEESSNQAIEEVSSSANHNLIFTVSDAELNKYLKLFHKSKQVDSIETIEDDANGTPLAYYVLFKDNKGWVVISADKRITPELSSCDYGSIDLKDTINPGVGAVLGMAEYVKEGSSSANNELNPIWEFISPSAVSGMESIIPSNINSPMGGDNIVGMWVAIDTLYVDDVTSTPRLITTSWGQGAPWNSYTPLGEDLVTHCKVGCAPVAVGQVIYKYLSSDSNIYPIPTKAYVSESVVKAPVVFSDFSSAAWSNMVLNAYTLDNLYNSDQTAIFLSWLGQRMGVKYGVDKSGGYSDNTKSVLKSYLYCRENNGVGSDVNKFADTILSSLNSGSPVLIFGEYDKEGHGYIIDTYSRYLNGILVTYEYDPNYIVSEQEMNMYPLWRFQMPLTDDKNGNIKEVYQTLSENIYIKINWGWQGQNSTNNPNNYQYLLTSKNTSSYDGIPVVSRSSYTSWSIYDKVYTIGKWFHHFKNK